LPEPIEELEQLLLSAVLEHGIRLLTFVAHPQGTRWAQPSIRRTDDLFGVLRL
jgi:hypothetical protein